MAQRKKIGRPAIPVVIRLHGAFRRSLQNLSTQYGLARVHVWRAAFADDCCPSTFLDVLGDQGKKASGKNLQILSILAGMLGVREDEVLIGRSIPQAPTRIVVERLNKLRETIRTPWAESFCIQRVAALPAETPIARTLGTTEGAIKVTVHRLRRRFRDQLRVEIGATVSDDSEIDDEIRYLILVLTG